MVGICTLQMFRKFWGTDVLIWGLRMGPQSYKNSLNLDYCSILMTNLGVGVRGFDEFDNLCWL